MIDEVYKCLLKYQNSFHKTICLESLIYWDFVIHMATWHDNALAPLSGKKLYMFAVKWYWECNTHYIVVGT